MKIEKIQENLKHYNIRKKTLAQKELELHELKALHAKLTKHSFGVADGEILNVEKLVHLVTTVDLRFK